MLALGKIAASTQVLDNDVVGDSAMGVQQTVQQIHRVFARISDVPKIDAHAHIGHHGEQVGRA